MRQAFLTFLDQLPADQARGRLSLRRINGLVRSMLVLDKGHVPEEMTDWVVDNLTVFGDEVRGI